MLHRFEKEFETEKPKAKEDKYDWSENIKKPGDTRKTKPVLLSQNAPRTQSMGHMKIDSAVTEEDESGHSSSEEEVKRFKGK